MHASVLLLKISSNTMSNNSQKTMGHWVLLGNGSLAPPPYDLRHLRDTHDYAGRVLGCAKHNPGWRYGWAGDRTAGGAELRTARELCTAMAGSNILLIGDSLSQQMYQSWRARLREHRFGGAGGEQAGAKQCGSSPEWCEGPAPELCLGLCSGKTLADRDQHAAHRAVCDNGATIFHAQAFRWVLDASSFVSSVSAACARRVRRSPYSFGLVQLPDDHLRHMVELASRASYTPHAHPRQRPAAVVERLVVVVNQFAHIHAFIER